MKQDLDGLIGFKDYNPNPITKETVEFAKDVIEKLSDFDFWMKYNDCYPYGDGSIKLECLITEQNYIDIIVNPNNVLDITHEFGEGFFYVTIFEKEDVTLETVINYLKQYSVNK